MQAPRLMGVGLKPRLAFNVAQESGDSWLAAGRAALGPLAGRAALVPETGRFGPRDGPGPRWPNGPDRARDRPALKAANLGADILERPPLEGPSLERRGRLKRSPGPSLTRLV